MGAYYQDSEHKSVNATGQRWLSMSALGHKQTSAHVRVMSALPPKADIDQHGRDVRFVPKADIPRCGKYCYSMGIARAVRSSAVGVADPA